MQTCMNKDAPATIFQRLWPRTLCTVRQNSNRGNVLETAVWNVLQAFQACADKG